MARPALLDVDLDSVSNALDAVAHGRPVVVADAEDEGALVVAAELITPATMAFLVRHGAGFVSVALAEADCERLRLPPMWPHHESERSLAHAVSVDAATGVGTGISARDRARTARVLADPHSAPADLTRPGHVIPERVPAGGVLCRTGPGEVAVDLAELAGMRPAAVRCGIVSVERPHRMAGRPELTRFAYEHGLRMITVAELVVHRRRTAPRMIRAATTAATG
jgi:3,4-dihydroxy 2-butanone 4-phosphate synthase/GTP cyclohydrolase II